MHNSPQNHNQAKPIGPPAPPPVDPRFLPPHDPARPLGPPSPSYADRLYPWAPPGAAPAPAYGPTGGPVVVNVVQTQNNQTSAGPVYMRRRWSPFLAGLLSFLCPGLGQAYKGQVLNALIWFVFTFLGYLIFILPGLFLHVCCVFSAVVFPAPGEAPLG